MMRYSVLFPAYCLLWAFGAIAQSSPYIYPIRENHRWGYITAAGKVVIEPTYDAFSESEIPYNQVQENRVLSPYRLVELNGKVGLLSKGAKEVLPCVYQRIRPLHLRYFAVEAEAGFYIVDDQNRVCSAGTFDDIANFDGNITAEPRYWLVKKDGRWGLLRHRDTLAIPTAYATIEPAAGKDYLKIKRSPDDAGWGLIDWNNQPVLPCEFENIHAYHSNFIAVKKPGVYWGAVNDRGDKLIEAAWRDIIYLNESYVFLRPPEDKSPKILWHVRNKAPVSLPSDIEDIGPFDENLLRYYKQGLCGLIDSGFRVKVPALYDSITPSGSPDILRVRNARRWGVYSLSQKKEALRCVYTRLGYFQDSLAYVQTELGIGMINVLLEPVLPPMFADIQRIEDTLKCITGDGRLSRYVVQGSKLVPESNFEGVRTIRIGKGIKTQYIEADFVSEDEDGASVMGYPQTEFPNFCANLDSSLLWRRDYKTKWWTLISRRGAREKPISDQQYADVLGIVPRRIVAVYLKDQTIHSSFAQLFAQLKFRLCRMALYDLNQQRFISEPVYLGIRLSDFHRGLPYAAFVDTSGQMGLINRDGKELQNAAGDPIRYTYIGPFIAGVARVCRGGQMLKSEKIEATGIGFRGPMQHEYCMREPIEEQYVGQDISRSVYIAPKNNVPPTWTYIDWQGRVLSDSLYDFVGDFSYDSLAFVQRGNKKGLIDGRMQTILPMEFAEITRKGRLFKVAVPNKKVYYFNNAGAQICDPVYDKYNGFAENMYAVRRDGRWGFVNTVGQERVACVYDTVRAFSGGLAAAVDSTERWLFVDTLGQVAFRTAFPKARRAELGNFSEQRCRFKNGALWGYYDQLGNIAIPPKFHGAGDFKNGVAAVRLKGKAGIIDTSGRWILEPLRYEEIQAFNTHGLAVFREKKDGPVGLLNTRGECAAAAKYLDISPFKHGFAVVKSAKGQGLLNRRGKELAPPVYRKIGEVSEGLVFLQKQEGHWILMDTNGVQVDKGQYQTVQAFSKGYALVNDHSVIDKKGLEQRKVREKPLFYSEGILGFSAFKHKYFADPSGENLFGRFFQEIYPYRHGIGKFRKNGKIGALNRRGVCIIQPKYQAVLVQPDGNVIVKPPLLYGLADKKGKIIVPPQYDRLEQMRGGLYRAELGEKVVYLKPNGEWVWR